MTTAPVLSTPSEHIFEQPVTIPQLKTTDKLSDAQLHIQYEIERTIREIRGNGWKRIALQFPDEMLGDAPRVFERLRDGLMAGRRVKRHERTQKKVQAMNLAKDVEESQDVQDDAVGQKKDDVIDEVEERLTILADTSYGSCCVDEIAAEHVDADVVVHYGRTCLSPTARLPVIYVFTSKPLDLDTVVEIFEATYPDLNDKICLMADIPYSHHVKPLAERLRTKGYKRIFETEVIHDPSSLLPNRTVPDQVTASGPDELKEYSIFHISTPPTSLLLILTSRVKAIHIYTTNRPEPPSTNQSQAIPPATTTPLLRRRYATLSLLPSVPIIGILLNTLSVQHYLSATKHLESIIRSSGKKSYTFVVGKLNPAKLANFAEVGVWVVVGCWESSLVEGQKDFFKPMVTPFELEVGLRGDQRVWGGEWRGGFEGLFDKRPEQIGQEERINGGDGEVRSADDTNESSEANDEDWANQPSDDEPPDFDLRTGRYVSTSRPIPRARPSQTTNTSLESAPTAAPSSSLVQRPKADLATVNGAVSPAAEFLRAKRTWQGLGSDYHTVEYERDEDGRIRGAAMEEGRGGVARGYGVGDESRES